jgi:hypothetical protein
MSAQCGHKGSMSGEEHTQRGKWSEAGVPHRGWTCIDIDDLGEPSQLCGMCEGVRIRYVHYMRHPDYPEVLGVGCVCAENMEGDTVRPREREARLRGLAGRRASWARREWRRSAKGNTYLNTEGYNLVVVSTPSGWRITVENRKTGRRQVGRKLFQTEAAAKEAALTALLWAKQHI